MSLGVGPPPPSELDDLDREPLAVDEVLPAGAPVGVEETTVRALLAGLAGGIGFVAGDADVPNHWRFTPEELDGIVPPLTRVINARPQLVAIVMRGDELTVGLLLAQYAGRNVGDQRRASRARRDNARPADHIAVDGGAGPMGPGDAPGPGVGGGPAGGDGPGVPWPTSG